MRPETMNILSSIARDYPASLDDRMRVLVFMRDQERPMSLSLILTRLSGITSRATAAALRVLILEREVGVTENGLFSVDAPMYINPATLERSRKNIEKAKAAHARLHEAMMAAPKPTEPVVIPEHLLEAFE